MKNRLSRTDISIREEAEPCELHEKLHCSQCERSKEDTLNGILKRSISTNAVNNIKRRTSVTNLHRTLSQTSCYSTGTTQSVTTGLQEESFNEFLDYISGNDKYDQANNLWEILPHETKEVFIKRVLAKKKKLNNEKLAYGDLRALLLAQNSKISTSKRYRTTTASSSATKRSNIHNNSREEILSQIIGQLFDEVSIQEDLKTRYGRQDMPSTCLRIRRHEDDEEKTPLNNVKNSEQQDLLLENDTAMERIRLWRDRQEINDKISELNHLIERYEQFSPLATPVSDKSQERKITLNTTTSRKGVKSIETPKQHEIHSNNNNNNSFSIFDMFASKSKKFIGRFKHKKKRSQFELYRKPNPEVRTLVDPQRKPR